jgi:tellurite resistance protein TehA-like permease
MLLLLPYIIPIALIWFVLYWFAGGVIFALIAALRVTKIRKAQFSCAFSALSFVTGFGAAFAGVSLMQESVRECVAATNSYVQSLAAVTACSIFGQMGAGMVFFLLLLCLGLMVMVFTRSRNQSWIDERHPEEEPQMGVQQAVAETLTE